MFFTLNLHVDLMCVLIPQQLCPAPYMQITEDVFGCLTTLIQVLFKLADPEILYRGTEHYKINTLKNIKKISRRFMEKNM